MIRPARPGDRDAVYRIARLTGDAGEDATELHDDPDLVGHVYAGPYLVHQPDLAFVATDDEDDELEHDEPEGDEVEDDDVVVVGYVLGAADVRALGEVLERAWWPPLRIRYPLDAASDRDRPLVELIHRPRRVGDRVWQRFPSEFHVDLLPRAQGRGLGRHLIETVLGALRDAGSPGVHCGVDPRNHRAIGFYERLGFTRDETHPGPDVILTHPL